MNTEIRDMMKIRLIKMIAKHIRITYNDDRSNTDATNNENGSNNNNISMVKDKVNVKQTNNSADNLYHSEQQP